MVSGYNEPAFPLKVPIPYKDSAITYIFLLGHPFRGVGSAYQEFRQQVGLENLVGGNPSVSLELPMYYDMQSEALAYACRMLLRSTQPNLWNPEEIVKDIDAMIGIFSLVRGHSRNLSNLSTQLRTDKQLDASSALLNVYLAEVASNGKNYAWAAELLKQASSSIPYYSNAVELPFQLAYHGNQEVLVPLQIPNISKQEWGEYIGAMFGAVEYAQKNTPKPHHNMLPDQSYHPKSLQAQKDSAIRDERYEDAARARDRIGAANGLILNSMANPFIRHVAYVLLAQLIEDGLAAHISADSFSLERIVNGSPEIIMSATGKVESDKTFTVPADRSLAARILNLMHNRPYVMKFGRFDSRLIHVGDS